MAAGWIKKPDVPLSIESQKGSLTNPILIDSGRIFVAKRIINDITPSNHTLHFLILNVNTGQWKSIGTIDGYHFAEHSIAFDEDKQLIYFCCSRSTMTRIGVYDLKSDSFKEHDIQLPISGKNRGAGLVIIDHKLHTILGSYNAKHFVVDIDEKKCTELYDFERYTDCCCEAALIYLRNKNMLWLIGGSGFDYYEFEAVDDIHTYSIKDNKWKLLDTKLPIGVYEFGYICTRDERYIIIIGGIADNIASYDKILVIDTESMEIKKSKIRSPFSGSCHACLVDNMQNADLVVNGFINECWNVGKWKNDAIDLRYPSIDIIGLIVSFYCIQTVYLFGISSLQYFQIDLMDLFQFD